ncbi:MAG: sulfatase-like hydrolase/transferase [Terracidiphilus sp.]
MKPRWFLEAIGASVFLLLPYLCPLLMSDHLLIYHHQLPLTNLIGGLLLDVLGLFLLGVSLLTLLARISPLAGGIVSASLTGLFISRILGTALFLLNMSYGGQSDGFSVTRHHFLLDSIDKWWYTYSHPILVASVALLAILAWTKPGSTDSLVRTIRLGLTAFAFCAFWIISQLLYMGFVVRGVPSFDRSLAQRDSGSSKRIVWILFDELSYNLTFDHPPSGQQFINFQRLRSESTSLGNIKPVGIYTENIIPSLLAGREIDQIRSTFEGKLLNPDSDRTREVSYDPNRTLFEEAKTNGWNPGVAGWYNPYCRIFADVLTSCSWVGGIWVRIPLLEANGASEDKSVLANSLVLPRALLAKFHSQKKGMSSELLKRNIQDYRSIMTGAQNLIQNGQIHFVFIHLPVPHPPGIYNRRTHQLSEGGNYLDNLALADDTLGALIREIDRTPSASETTIIISSDHSWRVPLWRTGPDWTQEEERVSLGQFDERPVFLVHFPGQKSGNEVFTSTPELIEHGIVESMLQGQIESPKNLDAFLLSSAGHSSEHAALRGQSKARY